MSLLGKKTYIEKVLDSLSENELKSVISLINTMDTREPTFVSLDPISSNFISNSNKGVSYVSFQLDNLLNLVVKGILIYNNSFCGLFAKGSHNNIEEYKIDVSKRTFVRVYENLTAEEFRQVCNDTLFAMSGGGGGGGGITVPTFTPTTFEIDLPNVDIVLSSQDCADIIQNQYPIITISHAVSENETISLTLVRNNSNSGMEKGEPYTNLQYDLIVDDDEDAYLVGLSFSDNDMKPWCMQIAGGESGGNVSDLYVELEDEPTQAQLEQIYTQKPDVLRIGMGSSENVVVLYKSKQSEQDTRLNYFNVQTSEGNVEVMKIEYSEEDGYIIEEYEWSLDSIVSGTNDGTNWTSLTIYGETHGIPQGGGGGTNVVANPTLEGTESDLIGLEVAGTKYKVPQGSSGTLSLSTNLVGKKLSLIGDSITTYSGWLPSGNVSRYPRGAITDVNQTWWKMLLDETGMIIGQNCAWDGSTCIGRSTSTTDAYGACSAKRISQLGLNGNPDIIICYIGINDWGATYNNTGTHYGSPFTNQAFVPVGSYTGETAAPSGDLQTFSEAYGSMIYNIQVKYPNAKIYCCTLLQTNGKATYNYDADGVFPSINRDSVSLAAYNERIRLLANNLGVGLIDFDKCGVNWGNMSIYLEDGLHPNKAGMKLLTEAAKAKLIADFGYVAQATPTTTYTITNNLTNATSNNGSTSVAENSSYTATISPASGYEILSNNVSITMGGTDITSSAWNNGVISIASVTGNIVINIVATVIVGTTYTITNSLTNVTNSNSTSSVAENATYTATLTADTGYSISSVSVTMGGTDVTSTVYNNGNINISAVTGNVVITASATPVAYSITNNLTNATSDNAATTINYGSSYSATITATSGYAITSASVTMGGVDITNTAYNNGVISIASVTGNLVITITAADPTVITWYTNFSQTNTSSFVASSRGWALDETTYANIYNKPINRISLVATANSGSIDICVAPSKNAQSGFTQQQTINWTSANKSGNIVTLELPNTITLSNGQYLCVYVNSAPASGAACYANGGNAGQFYSYVGSSGHSTWGDKGSYSIQMNIGYKA